MNDNICDKYDLEGMIAFAHALFRDLPKAYEVSDMGQKKVLLGSTYPSGLYLSNGRLLNRSIGALYQSINLFSTGHVAFSAKEFTWVEPTLVDMDTLFKAYPNYQQLFAYSN